MLDKATFYSKIRGGPLFKTLTQGQVNGLEQILDCWMSGPPGLFKPPVYEAMLAYMLATAYHETARAMAPVREGDWPGHQSSDEWRKKNLRYYPYYGRGLVQLTWKSNYQKATDFLREFYPEQAHTIDLVNNPDQALNPTYSVAIMFRGMSTGMFTNKSLHTYIHGSTVDFYHARQIINAMDKAEMIADYANLFLQAVKAASKAYKSPSASTGSQIPAKSVSHQAMDAQTQDRLAQSLKETYQILKGLPLSQAKNDADSIEKMAQTYLPTMKVF